MFLMLSYQKVFGIWIKIFGIRSWGKKVGIRAGKFMDKESQGRVEPWVLKIELTRIADMKKTYFILVSIFLAAILFYTLYLGQLLWGMVIDILILRLYFLLKRERHYFRECDLNEDEAGIPHDPKMKRRIWIANLLLTIFVLGLVVNSYFTSQFIWGIVAGLLILLYVHMLLFSGDNLWALAFNLRSYNRSTGRIESDYSAMC